MKVFVFDLLPYAEHLEHLKEGREPQESCEPVRLP